MIRRVELRRDNAPVGRFLAGLQGAERQDARELDLELDVAVLVEVPEEAVLIIFDGA